MRKVSLRPFPVVLCLFAAHLAAQERTARLEGTVVDGAGQPVPAAAVTIESNGRVVGKSASDADGWFVAARLPGERLVVHATEGARVGAAVADLTATHTNCVRIVLFPARKVHGRVVDAAGAPVAGAWVIATPADNGLAVIDACAQAGADGSWSMPHVLVGAAQVRAWAPGHESFEQRIDGKDEVEVACALGAEPKRELVFELAGASPEELAGARLQLRAERGDRAWVRLPPPLAEMQPDATGRGVVRGWSGDDRLLARFRVPGVPVAPAADFAPRGPRQWTLRADVQRTAEVRGVVRDERDQPLAGTWVSCRPYGDRDATDLVVSACTGADGSFRLPALVDLGQRLELSLVGSRHRFVLGNLAGRARPGSTVVTHDPEAVHELVAVPGQSLRLRVVDGRGDPVRSARVAVHWRQPGGGFGVTQDLRVEATGNDGRVECLGLDLCQDAVVFVEITGLAGSARISFTGTDEDVDLQDQQIVPGPALAGVVLDGDGKPAPGVVVEVHTFVDFGGQWSVVSGLDGRFAFVGMPHGECWVRLVPSRANSGVRLVLEARGRDDLELRVR